MGKYSGIKSILLWIFIICGAIWVLNTFGLIISLLLGVETFESYFSSPIYIDGEETSPISLDTWKMLFWSAFISAVLLVILNWFTIRKDKS